MKNLTVQELYETMDDMYPFATQMSFDNAGFLVGDGDAIVSRILVALDITTAVIEEAVKKDCQLIITHHPIIFTPLKTLVAQNPTERMIMKLISHNIAVISAHTNLDRSREGVNYHLAKRLDLKDGRFLVEEGVDKNGNPYGLGFMGTAQHTGLSASDFARFVTKSLDASGVRVEDAGKAVCKVAVGGGSCGSMIAEVAKQGCDTFVTGDVKYDQFLDGRERGINIIDAGHFPTEQVVCLPLATRLEEHLQKTGHNVTVFLSEVHKEVSNGVTF